jgi:hypothetical protein
MKNPPPDIIAHSRGSKRGEEWVLHGRREPGREHKYVRTLRDATGINAKKRDPIDPRMPYLTPA